jgi:hypothetical protein
MTTEASASPKYFDPRNDPVERHICRCLKEQRKKLRQLKRDLNSADGEIEMLEVELEGKKKQIEEMRRHIDLLRSGENGDRTAVVGKTTIRWTPKDILTYFQTRAREDLDVEIKVLPRAMPYECSRISRFQQDHEWTGREYAQFIDECYERAFTPTFRPTIRHLTSEKMVELLERKASEQKARVTPRTQSMPAGEIPWKILQERERARRNRDGEGYDPRA